MKTLLPIGSVVTLKNDNKMIMICGYYEFTDEIKTYKGCSYPNGYNDKFMCYFNEDDIDILYFVGGQDLNSLLFREELKDIKKKLLDDVAPIDILLDIDKKYRNYKVEDFRKRVHEEFAVLNTYAADEEEK